MGAEHDVDPRRPAHDLATVFLREAATDGDLHAGLDQLRGVQLAEVAVELVVGVLAHRAGVEHDDVGQLIGVRLDVARTLEQAGQPLGIVHVHLAAVGPHLIGARSGQLLWSHRRQPTQAVRRPGECASGRLGPAAKMSE